MVDCPSCGLTLRVPHLDGTVDPLPEPTMNLQDSSLVEALDELAHLDDRPKKPSGDQNDALTESANSVSLHAAVVAPRPIAAPKPIDVAPPLPAEPVSSPGWNSVPAKLVSSEVMPTNTNSLSDASAELALKELATQAPSRTASPAEKKFDGRTAPQPADDKPAGAIRRFLISLFPYPVFLSICAAAVFSFALGFVVGRVTGPKAHEYTEANANGERLQSSGNGSENDKQFVSDPFLDTHVSGRIMYTTNDGNGVPDRGAHVLLFPPERKGSELLSVVGFRPADSAEEFARARVALENAGGVLVKVDGNGSFQAILPRSGTFQILVLSHFQGRDQSEIIEPAVAALVAEYFERPLTLLGRLEHHLGEIRFDGTNTVTWGYSF